MATTFTLKLTDYGTENLIQKGAKSSFVYFSLGDMNTRYDVTAPNTYLSDLMNITGSRVPYTLRKSCQDAIPTVADVTPPSDDQINEQYEQIKYEFYKTDCGDGDFSKQNLNIEVNLHEWFAYLEGLVGSDYSQDTEVSLTIFQGISSILERKNVVDDTWERVNNTENFVSWFDFVSDVDRENYLKMVSKYVESVKGEYRQVDNSFDRFYSPLVTGFARSFMGNNYLEGRPYILSLHPPHMGYVVNGTTNFVNISNMRNADSYDTITPAARINDTVNGIYYLNELRSYKTTDVNGFIASAIWGYKNRLNESLIEGLITLMKNNIEYNYIESEFGVYELPINMRLKTSLNKMNFVGGNLNMKFIYDTNVTPTGLYDNIITVK
jgi:hypothetical protein